METKITKKLERFEKLIEASTWIVVIAVLFGIRFLPKKLIEDEQAYILIGAIVSLALLYYLLVYKYFSKTKRLYIKDIADIVLIGVLIHIVKDYGQYFFALYFLPIAAAALSLEFINALLIALCASVFVVLEVLLGSQQLLPKVNDFYQGAWQIGLILFITIFCRALAVQLRSEKNAKQEALAREKALQEEAARNKEFLSLTSHQLFTPLSMIRGFISLIKDENLGKLNEKQKDASKEIYDNTKRMIDLVGELMSISRLEASGFEPKKESADIKEVVEHSTKSFIETGNNRGLEIITESGETKAIPIDHTKIQEALNNLISNAVKYTQKGKILVKVGQDETNTTIRVIDQGVGIKQEDFDKLFQPFFRGKNILELDNQGTGLGLYISRLIIEKHGGKIWAENNKDGGATFAFQLPNG